MISMNEDWSHIDRMRSLLKAMHHACQLKSIDYPFRDLLTPEMIDSFNGTDLEEALVSVALPGKLIATGGAPGKVLEQGVENQKTGQANTRIVFHDRVHAITFAMEALERTINKIRSY